MSGPAPHPADPARTLRVTPREAVRRGRVHLSRGELQLAEQFLGLVAQAEPDNAEAAHFLGVTLHCLDRPQEAQAMFERASRLVPDNAEYAGNHGGFLFLRGRPQEAIPLLQRATRLAPDHLQPYEALAGALARVGRTEEAVAAGQRCLELRDRESLADYKGPPFTPPDRLPPFDRSRPERNIIAFSLWGPDPYYHRGAIENAIGRRFLYPEWTCRFYVDGEVPEPVLAILRREGAEVVRMADKAQGAEGLFWRFAPASETGIDYFLCRDADSIINLREKLAVEEWLASGRPFHLMRDHPAYCDLMLAGMWGGVSGLLPDLWAEAKATMTRGALMRIGADQEMLRERIWPRIRDHSLTHDSHFRLAETRTFPPLAILPPGQFVGGWRRGKLQRTDFAPTSRRSSAPPPKPPAPPSSRG